MEERGTELKAVGALWVKEGSKGKFFSGEIELNGVKTHILIFRNEKGGVDRRPDYRVHIEVPVKTEEETQNDKFSDSEIPF